MLEQLSICLRDQDFQSEELSSTKEYKWIHQNPKQQQGDDVIEWVPAILKPIPFSILFTIHAEHCFPSRRGSRKRKFCGLIIPSIKHAYGVVVRLRQLMGKMPKHEADKIIYEHYGQLIEVAVKNADNRGKDEDEALLGTNSTVNAELAVKKISFGRHILDTALMTYSEQLRRKQKQVVASSFCGVLIETLRMIEQFLVQECDEKIGMLSRQQAKRAIQLMVYCREHFDPEVCEIIYKAIKAAVGLPTETVYDDEIRVFYRALLTKMQETSKPAGSIADTQSQADALSKLKLSQMKQKFNEKQRKVIWQDEQYGSVQYNLGGKSASPHCLHLIWNKVYDSELLDAYLRIPDFNSVLHYFRKCYPQHRSYFSSRGLQLRFKQILRISLRKLLQCVAQAQWGIKYSLFKLRSKDIRAVIQDLKAENIRTLLIDYYRLEESEEEQLGKQIIAGIQQFLKQKESELEDLYWIENEVYLAIVRRGCCQAPDTRKDVYACDFGIASEIGCFVSPEIEEGMINAWLQPEYE